MKVSGNYSILVQWGIYKYKLYFVNTDTAVGRKSKKKEKNCDLKLDLGMQPKEMSISF